MFYWLLKRGFKVLLLVVLTFPNFPLTFLLQFPEHHSIFIDPCANEIHTKGPLKYNICTHVKVVVGFRDLFGEKWAFLTEILWFRLNNNIRSSSIWQKNCPVLLQKKPNFENLGLGQLFAWIRTYKLTNANNIPRFKVKLDVLMTSSCLSDIINIKW